MFTTAHLRAGGVEISVSDHDEKQGPVMFYADEIPDLVATLINYYIEETYKIDPGCLSLIEDDILHFIEVKAEGMREDGEGE